MQQLPDDIAAMVNKEMRVMHAELRAWRERHPREAASVREEALAKVEKRKPNYALPEAYGRR